MNKNLFMKELKSNISFSDEERKELIARSAFRVPETIKCTVVMEELAELIQQVSKQIRGDGDEIDLLEEMADVYLCLEFLRLIYCINPNELQKAIDVKLNRELKRME